uniref:Uncharacterized protein n=1 Tax=Stomoxys calcitrans TaxID=35570 RepID=A0A1I8NXQ6_STOCA
MAVFEQKNLLNIWWFPREFCQSAYGEFRHSGTNSCTLISLILANEMAKELVFKTNTARSLPTRAVEIFAHAMNEGNALYGRIFNDISTEDSRKRRAPNLNIPEAVEALVSQRYMDFCLQEWFYTHITANSTNENYSQSVSSRIADVMKLAIRLFKRSVRNNEGARNLFAAVISDNRTTMFVFDLSSHIVSFFDSHQHGRKAGAVIALCAIDGLEELANWFVTMGEEVYHSRPPVYEISLLTTTTDARNLTAPPPLLDNV